MKKKNDISQKAPSIPPVTILLISIGISTLLAFTTADLAKIKNTKSCIGCNLRHAKPTDIFSGSDRHGSDSGGATLRDFNLFNANRSIAKFDYAVLTGASLAHVYTKSPDFSPTIWLDGKTCKAGDAEKCKK